jgi:hypothetical protein
MPMDVIGSGQEEQLVPHLHGGCQESTQMQDHNMEGDDDLMNRRGGSGHSFYLENTTDWSVTSLVSYNQRGHTLYVGDSNLGPVDVLKDANQQGIVEDETMQGTIVEDGWVQGTNGVQGIVGDGRLQDNEMRTHMHLSLGHGSGVPPALYCLSHQRVLAAKPAYRAMSGFSSANLPSCKMPTPVMYGLSVEGGKVRK